MPIGTDDYFFLPLWTNWRPGINPGILDWYTVLCGMLAFAAFALHGSLYLALKTEGLVEVRALNLSRHMWTATVALTAIGVPATVLARPASLDNYKEHPIAVLVPLAVIISLGLIRLNVSKSSHLPSFLASCGYVASMIIGAGAGLFPVLLPVVGTQGRDITVERALSPPHTLNVGLAWWSVGICLAVMHFVIVYRLFRGKVPTDIAGYGH